MPSAGERDPQRTDGGWPASREHVNPPERARRAAVLRDIEARTAEDGPHIARAHPDRARQFMPFAALKGYHELAHSMERRPEARRIPTEEEAQALSDIVAGLHVGDTARVTHYRTDAYVETAGTVTGIDPAFRTLSLDRESIAFDDIADIQAGT